MKRGIYSKNVFRLFVYAGIAGVVLVFRFGLKKTYPEKEPDKQDTFTLPDHLNKPHPPPHSGDSINRTAPRL